MEPAPRRYLITGATGRLGTALARQLAQAGGEVVLVAQSAPQLAQARATLPPGARVVEAALDVADWDAVSQLAHRLHQQGGAVDAIVHAAGHFASGPLLAMDPASVSAIVRPALFGAHWIAKAFLPAMIERGTGTLVLVAAAAVAPGRGANPEGTSVPYLAAKAGLAALGRALATELAGTGVHAAVVFPPTFGDAAAPGVLAAHDVAASIVAVLSGSAPVSEMVLAPR